MSKPSGDKRISDHDAKEVAMFMQYLRDKERMPFTNFVVRYREYMGLTESETEALIKRGAGDKRGGE